MGLVLTVLELATHLELELQLVHVGSGNSTYVFYKKSKYFKY